MKLLILDRDGTLNRSRDDYVASPDEWEALPGALEAVARLNQGGWRVVLATNQSGIGRGLFDMASLNAIHAKMHRQLAAAGARVEAVFFCPHAPEDACHCRKPAPGLFEQIGARFGVPLMGVPVAGNALRHVQAGSAAGCTPHLLLTGKSEHLRGRAGPDAEADLAMLHPHLPSGTRLHDDLPAFAEWLLAQEVAPT
ncbi:MAG: D-glycero-beta-D-manno-heptose 1,7-bisphosphate 7-phosphatase [Gammaproteobacteria bacterium]|jgi:D-glycero-D-manno-heptose 1,7-bisphosphate phosphatase|uniref:D-glycero-beta-D-manno-heptose 1,7-bisphosphate 7-phosphatase n=1 Tax=Hydrogenophaga sp. TaxID=1904254 RepID=UPI0025C3F288|nr:D-glycero-beta-D-manno-heptose 1,7-bisphosphate 7-phosphatase [Hydrogenophaga sp.]MBU4180354.1 D-glycero-beta-D-manno-heptose 1,7-bisphosphate 7-phosphatase [Gammaproteobacteria bacterium]MBU4282708.1 D-glycero-beta-D-manno-heptose 1,7-bisphosphate 7-phosphatase [Gammaproteobacteria bacterium]MBU4325902.1 D-glycero-beta-D-manno-heptose 1,7-bisphosphate 7-phosphatase [Gammaproteobacteria bacterium]MBU4504778.1 D-glycero-beta-D-manno-heptose 1,7-bisphosphate 7-phosphatase [Gammaproteobacteria 